MGTVLWIGGIVAGWLVLSLVAGTLFALSAAARHRHGQGGLADEVGLPGQTAWGQRRTTSRVHL